MLCLSFCMRFILRSDGYRCADCGISAKHSRLFHKPRPCDTYTPYGKSFFEGPEYKAFQEWDQKLSALRSGVRYVDLTCTIEHNVQHVPSIYLLGIRNGTPWHIIVRNHKTPAWPVFVPLHEEVSPTEYCGLQDKTAFIAFNDDPQVPGFIYMLFCKCGWFRPASEPACTHHDKDSSFPGA